MSLLKDMRLEEFETVFLNADFSEEQITDLLRKEISEKYGRIKLLLRKNWKEVAYMKILQVTSGYILKNSCNL
jgi:hypothetical protein